jgi:hypothetical protein
VGVSALAWRAAQKSNAAQRRVVLARLSPRVTGRMEYFIAFPEGLVVVELGVLDQTAVAAPL